VAQLRRVSIACASPAETLNRYLYCDHERTQNSVITREFERLQEYLEN